MLPPWYPTQTPPPIPTEIPQQIIQTDNDVLNLLLAFRENDGLGLGIGLILTGGFMVTGFKLVKEVSGFLNLETIFEDPKTKEKVKVKQLLFEPQDLTEQILHLQQTVIELQKEIIKLKEK